MPPPSLLSSSGRWLWTHKDAAVLGGVAIAAAATRLHQLSQSQHVSDAETSRLGAAAATGSDGPLDATLFPQFIRSASVPSLWLYHRCWEVDQPRCVVFICHGFGEHIGRYEALAGRLNAVGASVYGLDHQGHGQSDGDRVHVEKFAHYVTDALTFIEHVQKGRLAQYASKPLPCFLLGHSMGGLMATQVMRASYTSATQPTPVICQEEEWHKRVWPWTGCILSGPALMANPADATPLMIRVGTFFSRVLPKLCLTPLDVSNISRVPAVVAQYEADVLNYHGSMRARWLFEMMTTMDEVRVGASEITWPMLILQGDADRLVHAPGATNLYETATSTDKKLRIWKGGERTRHTCSVHQFMSPLLLGVLLFAR